MFGSITRSPWTSPWTSSWTWGLLIALSLTSSCTLVFDRDFDPRDAGRSDAAMLDGGIDASAPDAGFDAGGLCADADDGAVCTDGRCISGVCCTGCIGAGGACELGASMAQCGAGGDVCRRCTGDTPTCFEGRCWVTHPIVEADLGYRHVCARDNGGRMYCWGDDLSGQLGVRPLDGSCASDTPLEVDLGGPVAQLSADQRNTCARLVDGSGYCWGEGLVGDGTVSPASSCDGMPRNDPASILPTQVVPMELPLAWRALASGGGLRFGLNEAGRPFYWGVYDFDSLPPRDQPTLVAGPDVRFVELVASDQTALGLTADGEAYLWGRDRDLSVGPLAVDVSVIGAGRLRRCVAYVDGRIECFGNNPNAALEVGPAGGRLVPRGTDTAKVTSVTAAIFGGGYFYCWTNALHELWCSFNSRPLERVTLGTETQFRSVQNSSGPFVALDTVGRLWRWNTGDTGRATLTILP